MTKADLRTGMVVEDRSGFVGVVLKGTNQGDIIKWFYDATDSSIINDCDDMEDFNSDLTFADDYEYDIVKIYDTDDPELYTTTKVHDVKYLIWEREEEAKEVTLKEVEEKFGCKVKIVG